MEKSIGELEERVAKLENLIENTGEALASICQNIDGAQTTKDGIKTFHCCVNKQNNRMYCASDSIATFLGIDTSNGGNTCDVCK